MADDADGFRKGPDAERVRAERRYVAALRALDVAAEPSTVVSTTAAAAATDVARLNDVWRTRPAGDRQPAGLFARLITELGRMLPWRRRRLHGAMIAAINRNAETTRALIDATQQFQSHLIWYAQTVAAFSATSRREANADSFEAMNQAIDGIATHWMMQWDSLQAREERYRTHADALDKAYRELITSTALTEQRTVSLQRAIEPLAPAAPGATPAPPGPLPEIEAATYVGFEDRFRGSREEIRDRLRPYVPVLKSAAPVLDLGCGRGELLDLLRENGVDARGVDTNPDTVAECRSRGLTVEAADGLAYLTALPAGSLGGLTAIQVVEHLKPDYLIRLLDAAHRGLAPGAPMVLETINPACWAAFFDSFIRDFTHSQPVHPETLQYLVQATGFSSVELRYLSPVADQDKLPSVTVAPRPVAAQSEASEAVLIDVVETVNAHAERLNRRLFAFRDYAIIARR